MVKRILWAAALTLGLACLTPREASAQWAVYDGANFSRQVLKYSSDFSQFVTMIKTAQEHVKAFRDAYNGLKDWKSMGWTDTLGILDMPWFDNVPGIDDIRRVSYLTVMDVGAAMQLWDALDPDTWQSSPRYRTDPWYRAKVQSLFRQSKRARATRAALLRQMQSQNAALIKDIEKMKRLRDAIQAENEAAAKEGRPLNQGKVASLQAELQATQAKYQGQELMLKNQQAIIYMTGADDAQRAYLETREKSWEKGNASSLKSFARGLSR